MEKKIRTHMTIPIFYHENKEGRIILDNEYMREYFENQLKKLYLETKLGKQEHWKKQLKKLK